MTILVTGFEPFGLVEENPSQQIVEYLATQANYQVITQVLPVDFQRAGGMVKELIDDSQADAILLLGVAEGRKSIALERIAVNINDARIADNDGNQINGVKIFEDAPVGYWSTLPLDIFYDAITKAEIAVAYSNHAGAYLCNNVMYSALHHLATSNRERIPCGFIHVPSVDAIPLPQQIEAMALCLDILLEPIEAEIVQDKF